MAESLSGTSGENSCRIEHCDTEFLYDLFAAFALDTPYEAVARVLQDFMEPVIIVRLKLTPLERTVPVPVKAKRL